MKKQTMKKHLRELQSKLLKTIPRSVPVKKQDTPQQPQPPAEAEASEIASPDQPETTPVDSPIQGAQEPDEKVELQEKKKDPVDAAGEQLSWIKPALERNSGLLCPLEDVTASPAIDGYRNKYEFTFGRNLQGEKSVGFLLGMFRDGITSVLEPHDCKNVSETGKNIALMLQVGDFVSVLFVSS
jgi:hypothetical protein